MIYNNIKSIKIWNIIFYLSFNIFGMILKYNFLDIVNGEQIDTSRIDQKFSD